MRRQSWPHIKVRQYQVVITSTFLFSHPISLHSPSINYDVYLYESATLSPFDKMLGIWYPEFVHVHVFMGIHETINKNQENLKH